MTRAFNFSAGPATLPESVLRQAQAEMLDWHGSGASIVEMSHRGAEFMSVAAEAEADLRRLLDIPDDYAVLFLSGGATTHQALLALNFAAPGQVVDYVVTGHWGKTAIKQAMPYCTVNIAADGEATVLQRVPPEYPASALRDGRSGTVVLKVRIDAEGNPGDIDIEKSSGTRALDRAARDAVRQWRFSPRTVGGTPVASELSVPVDFKLEP